MIHDRCIGIRFIERIQFYIYNDNILYGIWKEYRILLQQDEDKGTTVISFDDVKMQRN